MKIYIVNIEKFLLNVNFDEKNKYNNIKEYILKRYLNCEISDIKYNEYKKPYLDNLNISISHSDNYYLFATSNYEIGIDIERVKNYNPNILKKTNTKKEILYIRENPLERFYILWTLKESLVKAYGTGFDSFPNDIEVDVKKIENGYFFKNKFFYSKCFRFFDYYISITSDFLENIIFINLFS